MTAILDRARAAYRHRDWPTARELFVAASETCELSADDQYALSDAAWWLGDNDRLLEACERAYGLYLEEGRPSRAAYAATDIAVVHFLLGEETIGSGWIARARRLLDGEPESAEHGYLLYILEVEGPLGGIAPSEPAVAEKLIAAAQGVQEIGRRHGDATLVACGILGEGRALLKLGEVDRGLTFLDEVMLAALADDLAPAWTGNLFCQLIEAVEELGDLRRAREWTAAMTRWLATMPEAVVFSGICRVHRSRVHQLTGAWDEAEGEATRVCEELGRLHVAAAAKAHYQVGEIRRLRGDSAGAAVAYQRARELGRDPQPGQALLRLAQGQAEAAAVSIRAAILAERNPLVRAGLRAAQVEIALATGAVEEARDASEELEAVALRYPSCGTGVAARHARGAILLAQGHPDEALPVLRDACRTLTDVEAPYDCARVRILLVHAYRRLGDREAAARELEVARAAFDRLGALADLRRTEELRDDLPLPGKLTPREAEVLVLVASGSTNKAIARDLSLSEKTVARHLANIFAKLGVGSRTAAAAFAFERGLVSPGSTPPRIPDA